MENIARRNNSGLPALSDLFLGRGNGASAGGGSHHPTGRQQRLGASHAPKRIGSPVQIAPRKQNKN